MTIYIMDSQSQFPNKFGETQSLILSEIHYAVRNIQNQEYYTKAQTCYCDPYLTVHWLSVNVQIYVYFPENAFWVKTVNSEHYSLDESHHV